VNTKQVIVIRKDLNMRKGKMCAQASHASMSFLTKQIQAASAYGLVNEFYRCASLGTVHLKEIDHWLNNSFRKIVVSVNSDEELLELYEKCKDNKLMVHLITDNGATEFNGVPTRTCLAIGTHWDEKFENITSHLPLL
jgi:PTH2 family peptidyl-tRNA hydrolase